MTVRLAQFGIASVFLLLGAWALLAPQSVIDLTVTPEYRDSTYLTRFALRCFGAQAVLFAVMASVLRWTSRAFAVFAILLLPFFLFNWYFHYEVKVLTSIGMLDFVGNVVMLAIAIVGWRATRRADARA